MSTLKKVSENNTADTQSATNQHGSSPSSTLSPLPARSTALPLPTHPPSIPSLLSSVPSDQIDVLEALSQEPFASPVAPIAASPTKSGLTLVLQQRVAKNRQQKIRCRNGPLRQKRNELQCNSKSQRTSFDRSPKRQLRNLFLIKQYYNGCSACHKFCLCD